MEPSTPDFKLLALRAYPELKHSGYCSAHRGPGHFACQVCYPDWPALIHQHTAVTNALYDDLLKLSGLSDPPNGRIGTNAIIAEISRRLNHASQTPTPTHG